MSANDPKRTSETAITLFDLALLNGCASQYDALRDIGGDEQS